MVCLDLSLQNSIRNCECWDGYKAEYNKNGSQCVGVNLFHIMPCNMARAPKCQCSGRVSSILKDRTGTWCTRYTKGEELTRKLVLIFAITTLFVVTSATQFNKEKECQCWENFTPEWDPIIEKYFCRGGKHQRIVNCNEEKPPVCKCEIEGKTIELEPGETDCATVTGTREKLLLLWSVIVLFTLAKGEEVTNESDCKCWEDFKPEKESNGYYCRGEKNHRIFSCNEEKPPICHCVVDGKTINLDLGETNCLSVNLQTGRWCHNRAEFETYFRKHPERAIYD
ncbi:uncharacterized protein BDFB_004016 [Asbolus verrucosus]|uniref:Uncharacterized protein n=1 Tax=Asbolus verrucosus TaxID=1661398 RepID=A0A482V972_ASBVE|nr:uncharacterized protein BDFB_004016 [Asbolus verrucosus]